MSAIAIPPAPAPAAPRPPDRRARRGPAAHVWVVAVLALATLLGATVTGLIHLTKRDADGYYTSSVETLSTPTHALVSDGLDVDDDGGEAFVRNGGLGTLRVSATPANGKPVFVGIARSEKVDAYLQGVARDDVTDFEVDPFSITTSRRHGKATPAAPVDQSFWARSASGTTTRTIQWPVKEGSWDVVVMNADGTSGVRADVRVAARLPLIGWIAGGLLALGGVLAIVAAALFVADRGRR
jgi:hypothetical protein